ncbi:hypothetical protein EP331_12720 [bacterium]|nr:MAG: hypothetical protein EP331_12720 [bacterium]
MNKPKVLLFAFIFVFSAFLCTSVKAQPVLLSDSLFQQRVSLALDSLYNLKFVAARTILKPYQEKYPKHPFWNFWSGLELWWNILPNIIDESRDAEFFYHFKKCDYEATRVLQEHAYHTDALILKILANGFLARQYANRDEWIKSLNYARIGIESLLTLKEIQPDLVDIQFGDGLYEYYMDYLPKEYPWLQKINWALPDGNKEKGLSQLAYVAENGLFLKYESLYFLANINENYEKKHDLAENGFEELVRLFPNNPFYAKRLIQIYCSSESAAEALPKSINLLNDSTYMKSDTYVFFEESAAFRIANVYLSIHQTSQAEQFFNRALRASMSLKKYSNRYYYGAICYYLGHICISKQDFKSAKSWLRKVPKTNTDYFDRAKEQLKSIENL